MADWLASTWGANWRSFQYFNLYRVVLAGLFLLAFVLPHGWVALIIGEANPNVLGLTLAYLAVVLAGLFLSMHVRRHFDLQLSMQISIDVLSVTALMFTAGGVGSGIGITLLISLAAASLLARGRQVLFYAAQATLAVLLMQIYGVLFVGFDFASIFQAGMLSAGFFATAILARLLGQRVMLNEELARRRGEALENQQRISQRVVERMQDGVLVLDGDARVMRHNPVAMAMLSLSPQAPLQLGETASGLVAAWRNWSQGGAEAIQFVGPAGRELRARFEKTDSTEGETLIFLEDVGRIRERAQQMKLVSLGRLTASIAHEIRNPLAAISHAGELLREEPRREVQTRLLQILSDNVARLDRIVGEVLSLGRQKRAEAELVRLDAFCEKFVADFCDTESLPRATIVVDAEAQLVLAFDRAHLHQVLWNLLGNAVRHSRRGERAILLMARRAVDAGRVELHVIDDGPGVSEAVREQIFEPFFTTHHQGTGLGLFIARELCALNGATLELVFGENCGHFVLTGRDETWL